MTFCHFRTNLAIVTSSQHVDISESYCIFDYNNILVRFNQIELYGDKQSGLCETMKECYTRC